MLDSFTSIITVVSLALPNAALPRSAEAVVRPVLILDTNGPVSAMAVSPDGKTIATATVVAKSKATSVVLWDTASWKKRFQIDAHARSVSRLAFSINGKLLATASFDDTIKVWDVSTGKQRLLATVPMDSALGVHFLKESGKMVAQSVAEPPVLVNYNSGAKIDLSGKLSIERKASCSTFAVSNSRTLVALATGWLDKPNVIVLRDLPSGQELRKLTSRSNVILCTEFSPNDTYLAVGYMHNDKGHELVELKLVKNDETIGLAGHKSPVHSLAFSGDGALLASADNGGTIVVWDVIKKLKLFHIEAHSQQVTSILFLSNYRLVSASHDRTIKVWNLEKNTSRRK